MDFVTVVMKRLQNELQWFGPFTWLGEDKDCLFNRPEAIKPGIYLWTVPFKKKYLVYYVGETGVSFSRRFTEHTRDYLSGYYRVYNPQQFSEGKKQLVWEGMWKPGTRNRMGEFLKRYLELSKIIYEFLGKLRIFLSPLEVEKNIRQRIEGTIADSLYKQQGIIGDFPNGDIRYKRRQPDESPICVKMKFSRHVLSRLGIIWGLHLFLKQGTSSALDLLLHCRNSPTHTYSHSHPS